MCARMRRLLATTALALAFPAAAHAAGGDFAIEGGTGAQRSQVAAALAASSFPWAILGRVTIHVGRYGDSYATPGEVFLDAGLLDAGRFAWSTVQHEVAHQVDFLLLDAADRERLRSALGARDWCWEQPSLPHAEHGCERLASTLVWAYWPSPDNAGRPEGPRDEAAALAPAAFRSLLADVLRRPELAAAPRARRLAR